MSRIIVNEHTDHTVVMDIPYQTYRKSQDKYCLDLFLPRSFFSPGKDQIQKMFTPEYPLNHKQVVERDSHSLLKQTASCCHDQKAPACSNGKASPPPVVVFVHGGGWQRGCRRAWTYFGGSINLLSSFITWSFGLYQNVGSSLASRGVACAVISYPLTRPAMPLVLLDIIVSYSCSAIFSSMVYQLISITCLFIHSTCSFLMKWEHALVINENSMESANRTFVLSVTLSSMFIFNNYLILLAMFICSCNNPFKGIPPLVARLLWTTVSVLLAHLSSVLGSETAAYTYLCTSLLCISIQLHSARQWQPVSNSQQIRAITTAFKWIKNCSERTSLFDSKSIFLMGHSAGGQLVSQLALDKHHLEDGGCSSSDIKGVVSISGVYDLQKLSSPVLRRLYLHPAFGPLPDNWLQASPIILISEPIGGRSCPPFLLLTAQIDGHLNRDADEFCEKLKLRNVPVIKHIIPLTMHLTIMACFSVFQSSVCQKCVDFIKDNTS